MMEARTRLRGTELDYYALSALHTMNLGDPDRLPVTVKILLEMALRDETVSTDIILALARWGGDRAPPPLEIPFKPVRVLSHDYTGTPALVDLAAMRDALRRSGGDPHRITDLDSMI